MTMIVDLHTHHDRCGHALGSIEQYIQSAIEKELAYIGISDHTPFFYAEEDQLHPHIAMPKSELNHYVTEVIALKNKYANQINVLLGIESDFFEAHQKCYKDELSKYPFDYIIGSVHYVDDVNIFKKDLWHGYSTSAQIELKERYYQLIQASAKSGMFQILGHIDAMKGYYPEFSTIQTPIVEKTLKVIAEQNVAIEVNTSGKTKDCGGWYPSIQLLEFAQFYGVDITFGSDAHHPERVADDYNEVQCLLKQIGFKEMVFYVGKHRHAIMLE